MQGLRQARRDIRQPIAGVLAPAAAALSGTDPPENARDASFPASASEAQPGTSSSRWPAGEQAGGKVSEVPAGPCEAATGQDRLRRTSHELKQLVAAVLFPATAALEEPGLSPAVRRHLERIIWQGNWLADMIQDFLWQAQPDGVHQDATQSGTVPWETPPAAAGGADVVSVVNEAVAFARLTWPGRATVKSPPGPVRCQLHPIVLRRVISNVLSNATRAAGPSGIVTIRIRRQKGATMLSVRDSGPGFGKIPRGSGIGLAAVARIIARYGGRIELGSGTGGGACVSLWLP